MGPTPPSQSPPPPGPKSKAPPVLALKTAEEAEFWVLERSDKTLLVIDVHAEWCGPSTDVLESFIRKTALEFNHAATHEAKGGSEGAAAASEEAGGGKAAGPPLQFLTANRQLLGPKLRALLFPSPSPSHSTTTPATPQPASASSSSSSSSKQAAPAGPHFAMDDGMGGGNGSSGSNGASAAVAALLESGGSQPLFLFIKGKQLVGVVRGVNPPALLLMVQQNVTGGGAPGAI